MARKHAPEGAPEFKPIEVEIPAAREDFAPIEVDIAARLNPVTPDPVPENAPAAGEKE